MGRPLLHTSQWHSFGGCHFVGWCDKDSHLWSAVPQWRWTITQSVRVHLHRPNRRAFSVSMLAVKHIYHFAILTCHFDLLSYPTDSSTPFILTPTSLLPKHAMITDAQQITGSNGQRWIKCTSGSSGREGTGVHIHSAVNGEIVSGNRMKTATIRPGRYPRNGLYYCLEGKAPRYYISLFLRNSSKWMAHIWLS